MKLLSIAGALALATALVVPAFNASAAPKAAAPTPALAALKLAVDGTHSSMVFRIRHMNTSEFYGRFNRIGGDVVFDEAEPSKCSVKVTIAAESVDTNDEKRDQHVKSPDFLDAKQFPELSFTSKRVAKVGDLWKVTGDLELHGVKQELTAEFEKTGESEARGGGQLVGFHTRFTIDRTKWGIVYGEGALGKDIEISLSLETQGS
jgi:polyisoprenoid-binding protein YceI